jgi:hypothetical protein
MVDVTFLAGGRGVEELGVVVSSPLVLAPRLALKINEWIHPCPPPPLFHRRRFCSNFGGGRRREVHAESKKFK